MKMDHKPDKWKLNRLPTKPARWVGVIGGSLLVIVIGFLAATTFHSSQYIASGIFSLVTIYVARIAYKAAFFKAALPSNTSIKLVSYTSVVMGLCMIIGAFFVTDLGGKIQLASMGLLGLGAAIRNLKF
jgi:hypothetical protein